MGVIEFFSIYFLGESFNSKTTSIGRYTWLFYHTALLIWIFLLANTSNYFLRGCYKIKHSRIGYNIGHYDRLLVGYIPILGRIKIKLLDKCNILIEDIFLQSLNKLCLILPILIHIILIKMCFSNNDNVKMFFTEKSKELSLFNKQTLLTTLIISNHRSLNDYLLLSYLSLSQSAVINLERPIYELFGELWDLENLEEIPFVSYVSWGSIYNMPKLKMIKTVLLKDENTIVSVNDIKEAILQRGKKLFIIFPEVNILTTELAIIQRKLNQDYYPFVRKYYHVLSPRFQHFTNLIKGLRKTINSPSVLDSATVNVIGSSTTRNKSFNPRLLLYNKFLYDLTVVYYRPILSKDAHDHESGTFQRINGFQLQEINPSFIELIECNLDRDPTTQPIIVLLDIQPHEITPLLLMKEKKLEKWLEMQWIRKEKLISSFDTQITVE